MAKTEKFKFRKEKAETGLAAVASCGTTVRIKIGKDVVGEIRPPSWSRVDNDWSVRLTVVVPGSTEFKWVTLKKKFANEQEAREHLSDPEIFAKISSLGLYREPDDYSDW